MVMDNEDLVREWQNRIIAICEERLGRPLSSRERLFITSRAGFIALEMIEDAVSDASAEEIGKLLNSD